MQQAALETLTRAGVTVVNPEGIIQDILEPENGQPDKGSQVGSIIGARTGRASKGDVEHN